MRLEIAAAATAFAILSAPAAVAASLDVPAGTYAVDNTHLSVLWRVKHMGLSNYTGQFDPAEIDAVITLDPENVANSSVSVTIPAAAVLTNFPGETDFDAEVASPMFLDAANHPAITFTSSEIEVTGENTAAITGDVTIRGVTLPLTLDVTLNGAITHPMAGVPALGISAVGRLNRSDFGVNTLVGPIVSDAVDIVIEAEFLKAE